MQPLIAPLYEGRLGARVLGTHRRRSPASTPDRDRQGLLDPRAAGRAAGRSATPTGQPFKSADASGSARARRVHPWHGDCRRRTGTPFAPARRRPRPRRSPLLPPRRTPGPDAGAPPAAAAPPPRRRRELLRRAPLQQLSPAAAAPAAAAPHRASRCRRPRDHLPARSRRSGTAASPTTAGCRSCPSR